MLSGSRVTNSLMAILLSSVATFSQTVLKDGQPSKVSPRTRIELIDAVRSGTVNLMASYDAMTNRGLETPHEAVGCSESAGRTWAWPGDEKRAVLIAGSILIRRNDFRLSGTETLDRSGIHQEITAVAVGTVGPFAVVETETFSTPTSSITCVLIRESAP